MLKLGVTWGVAGFSLACQANTGRLYTATTFGSKIWKSCRPVPAPPPKVDDYFYTFYENVLNNNLQNIVIPIRGDSAYTLNIHRDESIDLAFIDGDHSFEGALKDLNAILPKMKKDGTILCHDCRPGSDVSNALRDFCVKNAFEHVIGFERSSIVKIHLKDTSVV